MELVPRVNVMKQVIQGTSQRKVLLAVTLGLAAVLAVSEAHAKAALAIDHAQGRLFGWAINYGSKSSAEEKAVQNCGPRCRPVLYFDEGCGAYATDQVPGSPVYGWAVREDQDEAKRLAVNECTNRGGQQCALRVWACERE